MTFTIDGETYDDEFDFVASRMGLGASEKPAGESKAKQGTVGTIDKKAPPQPPETTFDSKYNPSVEDLIMLNSQFKEWADKKWMRRSPNVDNRIEDTTVTPLPPVTQDDVDQSNGVFINPGEVVDHPIAKSLGANELNRQIIQKESQPPTQRDDIGRLLEDLRKKHPEHFPK